MATIALELPLIRCPAVIWKACLSMQIRKVQVRAVISLDYSCLLEIHWRIWKRSQLSNCRKSSATTASHAKITDIYDGSRRSVYLYHVDDTWSDVRVLPVASADIPVCADNPMQNPINALSSCKDYAKACGNQPHRISYDTFTCSLLRSSFTPT